MKIIQTTPPSTFKFTCPRCQQSYEGPWSMHRQEFNCGNCGQHFRTPRKPVHWVFIALLIFLGLVAWDYWRSMENLNAFLDRIK